ncbi:bifunctional lysylphosphatidylglycerol flippase/synthetase MprF [Humibacter ginsenosidimutans]|uniref:DUF2156 domain-containing protein n=1 Tax=Humibacter ginsenosidimutans TaxID=2599293 RepID=A0A5B8M3A4_9MICO|nr:DUF2156 domain-containing protein [Humibacter ginsenosidimutans]QDZ15278.1 DUF2156 domain-containing protein [Humibacter ginsenosidimutans]
MLRRLRSFPATTTILSVLVVAAIAHMVMRALRHGHGSPDWGVGYTSVVHDRQPWRMLLAPVGTASVTQLVLVLVLAAIVLPIAESRLGSRRATIAWAATGILGPALGLAVQTVGVAMGENGARATQHTVAVVPFAGILGILVITAAIDRSAWLRSVSALLLATCTVVVLYTSSPVALAYLLSGLIGWSTVALARRADDRQEAERSRHGHVRVRMAFLVAATVAGPVIAMTRLGRSAPLAPLGEFFLSWDATAPPFTGLLLDAAPLVLLALGAYGLSRGSRAAAITVICWAVTAGLLALWSFGILPIAAGVFDWNDGADVEQNLTYLAAGAVLAAIAVLTASGLRHFAVRVSTRQAVRTVAVAAACTVGILTVFLSIASAVGIDPRLAWSELGVHIVPPSVLSDFTFDAIDATSPVAVLASWAAIALWLVPIGVLGAFIVSARPESHATDVPRLRHLLREHGGGTFGFMATWPGNRTWFSADGSASVTYRLLGRTVIVLSDPVCAAGRTASTITEFIAWCDDNGRTPAFYSAHDEVLDATRRQGWQAVEVGVESLIPLDAFTLTGKRKQNIRTAINRAQRENVRAEWTTYEALDADQRAGLKALSRSWKQGKPLPEMGFTLGRFEQLADPEVQLMLAYDDTGALHAVTSWLPVHRSGRLIGYTLDVMRRSADAMPGVIEFLIASTALGSQQRGLELLSLSGSPLAGGDPGTQKRLIDRMTARVGRALEPVYHFRSLASFKAGFEPQTVQLWLAYRDETTLPATAAAIAKAYVPIIRVGEAFALLRSIAWRSR